MIDRMFQKLASKDETALIVYIPAGFPSLPESMDLLKTIGESGADLIELGVPFCDPVADGPTIQAATQQALDRGATLRGILDALREAGYGDGAEDRTPLSLMSYLNPLLALGREALLAEMAQLKIAGLIIADLPLEEADEWVEATRRHGISLSLLVAPTSGTDRARRIAELSGGFVYYVSVTGITGARTELPEDLLSSVAELKSCTKRPVAVGFGIATPDHVQQLRNVPAEGRADAVVVGSRVVRAIQDQENVAELIRSLKAATRS